MHFPYLVKGRLLSLTHCSCILIVPSWIVLQLLTLVCSVIPFLILWYVEYLMVQPVEAQYNVLFQKKVCVKNYLLLQQSLLFVIPPTPSHSHPFPLAPSHFDHWYLWCLSPPRTFYYFSCHKIIPSHFFVPCSTSSFLFFVGVFSHNIIHFDRLILKYLSSPYTFHVSLLTPRASEIVLINGDGVNGVFKGAQHLRQRSFRNPLLLIKILVSNNSCP